MIIGCWWLVSSVYSMSLPVTHLSDAPRRRLVVTGDSARIQDKTTENSAWFFNVLGEWHSHRGPRFNVSSERLLAILVGQPGFEHTTCSDPKHCDHESYGLLTKLICRLNLLDVFKVVCYIFVSRCNYTHGSP